jgi:hypothetical protein
MLPLLVDVLDRMQANIMSVIFHEFPRFRHISVVVRSSAIAFISPPAFVVLLSASNGWST